MATTDVLQELPYALRSEAEEFVAVHDGLEHKLSVERGVPEQAKQAGRETYLMCTLYELICTCGEIAKLPIIA